MQLNEKQKEALLAAADALLPSINKENDPDGYWKRKGSDFDLVSCVESLISAQPFEAQKEFFQLVDLLGSPLLGFTWFGPPKKMAKLSLAQQEKMLNKWAESKFGLLRNAFLTLKKLVAFTYFGFPNEGNLNSNWKSMGYPGPLGKPASSSLSINTLIKTKRSYDCDTVIIGSGAGGGVVAGVLSKAGEKVIVVEKGPYFKDDELSQLEFNMVKNLYDRQGAMVSQDGAISVLAGSCLGGGTTVNWAGSFRTPDYVLQEWATEHKNPQFLDPEYKLCFEAIEQRLGVKNAYSHDNPQNAALRRGATKLGYHCADIPHNIKGGDQFSVDSQEWKGMGYAGLGDAFGVKQSMVKTYLQDAVENGASILVNTTVEKVIIEAGEAKGVIAYKKDENGIEQEIIIKAKRVVVSAGSIHSPAVLMRSGLRHKHLGKHLYLHPVVAVSALYKEKMNPWYGPMMSAVSDEFTKLNGNFGFKLETPPVHTGMMGMSVPWSSGEKFKQDMLQSSNYGMFIILTRDKFGGSVQLGKKKEALINYNISDYDLNHLLKGMQEATKIHVAAGADEVRILHNKQEAFDPSKDNLEEFLERITNKNWGPMHFPLFSAHQMGTCRMGGDNSMYPVKPNGETREAKNLFVADASVFPQCSGANPMLSIQALAYYIAINMKT